MQSAADQDSAYGGQECFTTAPCSTYRASNWVKEGGGGGGGLIDCVFTPANPEPSSSNMNLMIVPSACPEIIPFPEGLQGNKVKIIYSRA